jgi:ubiquinone/menaquinone biosynthesis C-methylase UbiE
MSTDDIQKQHAIALHSAQAPTFASRYDTLSSDTYRSCFAYSRHRLDGWLARFLPARGDGLRVLDVGCGTGHHVRRLRDRGFEVAGVDGSPSMLAHARADNPGADLRQAPVDALPFDDDRFDIALCIEVLRYVPDVSPCLREMARVLKPGGACLATAAPPLNLNAYWPINRLAVRLPLGNLVRLKQFFASPRELRRRFVAAGFEAPAVHGVYFGPVNWVERGVPRALPRLLRAWEPIDRSLADRPLLRDLSNMVLVHARRAAPGRRT